MRAVVAMTLVALTGMARADDPVAPEQEQPPPQPEQPPPAEQPPVDPNSYDKPAYRPIARKREIVVEVPGERSRTNKLVAGGLALGGVVFGAIGVKYHLDSRDASDAVSAQVPTGRPWTSDLQGHVDRGADARRNAMVGYSIGGALLVGAIVTWIVTEPQSSREVIRPHLAISSSGTTIGGAWSW